MTNILPSVGSLLLAVGCVALSGCSNDSPAPVGPVTVPQTVSFQFGMAGYMAAPTTVARFGVAATQDDAQKGRGTLYTGRINYSNTKSGKETVGFDLPDQPKGIKRWVYVSTASKPTGNQTITLNWNIVDMLTLTASSPDTIVIKELLVQ